MSNKFFGSPKGKKKLQKLRHCGPKRQDHDAAEEELEVLPPSEGELAFKNALHQHETESIVKDYDDEDDDEDNDHDNDNDNDEKDNEEVDEEDNKDDSDERLVKFRHIVADFADHMGSQEGGAKSVDDVRQGITIVLISP